MNGFFLAVLSSSTHGTVINAFTICVWIECSNRARNFTWCSCKTRQWTKSWKSAFPQPSLQESYGTSHWWHDNALHIMKRTLRDVMRGYLLTDRLSVFFSVFYKNLIIFLYQMSLQESYNDSKRIMAYVITPCPLLLQKAQMLETSACLSFYSWIFTRLNLFDTPNWSVSLAHWLWNNVPLQTNPSFSVLSAIHHESEFHFAIFWSTLSLHRVPGDCLLH